MISYLQQSKNRLKIGFVHTPSLSTSTIYCRIPVELLINPMQSQYYEMSYGLNVEMHKQTEICKRLDAIIRQVLPFLNGEHQQQVAVAVERAKQITMTELTALMQVRTRDTRHVTRGDTCPGLQSPDGLV